MVIKNCLPLFTSWSFMMLTCCLRSIFFNIHTCVGMDRKRNILENNKRCFQILLQEREFRGLGFVEDIESNVRRVIIIFEPEKMKRGKKLPLWNLSPTRIAE